MMLVSKIISEYLKDEVNEFGKFEAKHSPYFL
jgi:hypothetical protein